MFRNSLAAAAALAAVIAAVHQPPVTFAQAPAPASAQAPAPASMQERRAKLATGFAEIDRLFTEFATRNNVPGAAWGIVIDGELAHSGVAGLRDVATKAPVERDTVFRIASMTKSFTAMAILNLRDDGKLALDDPAEKYVPEMKGLEYPTSDSPRITIRHLLSHAEGFPEDNAWADRHLADSHEQFSKMLRAGIPFSNAPGIAYEYSNFGFAILGRVVTRASGMPYNDYIQSRILRPLGMTSTTLEPASVPAGRLAQGYRREDDQWKLEEQLPDGAFGAMGGMLTSIPDLSRYVGALLAAWPPRDGAESGPIRRASLREMQQIARTSPTVVTKSAAGAIQVNSGGYGYGLRVSQSCEFGHIVAHSGGLPGFGSIMRWLPEYGVGIMAFGNLTYTGWGGVAASALDRLVATAGLQPRPVTPAPALVEARATVARLVSQWDDAAIERIAADNFFLDQSKERRRVEMQQLQAKVGRCEPGSGFDYVENALRGDWTMTCERGSVRVAITLAPTMPPKLQVMSVRPVEPGAALSRRRTCPE